MAPAIVFIDEIDSLAPARCLQICSCAMGCGLHLHVPVRNQRLPASLANLVLVSRLAICMRGVMPVSAPPT
jgi:hypothetical protein